MLANIHSILVYDIPGTEHVCLRTKFQLNVGPAFQPIAGSMLVNCPQRWSNTYLSPGLLYTLRKQVAFNQRCFDIDPLVRAHLSKRGILKVCKAFLSRICHAVVFRQFGHADSKSAPCQALFLFFSFQNCKTKWPPK